MADWKFRTIQNKPNLGFTITACKPSFGDAFSPPIPVDKLKTLNWNNYGNTHVYAANMDYIGTYGRAEKMSMGDNQEHMEFKKVILVAASDEIEYYCLSPYNGTHYMDGYILEFEPNEERTLEDLKGTFLFLSDGSLSGPNNMEYDKHYLLTIKNLNDIKFQAGPEGAVVVVFWKDERD